MCLNLADAMALYENTKSNPDVIVQVGTQKTRLPKYLEARRLIRAGAIGTPTFSQTSYCRNVPSGEWHYTIDERWQPGVNLDWDMWCGPLGSMEWDPHLYYQWRRYRKTSTGIIGDLLVHEMTPILMAVEQGWPVRVAATGAHLHDKEMENHDNVNLAIQFETGHQMFVAGSTCNEQGIETLIRGHKANLFLAGRNCELRPERPYVEEIDPETVQCPDIGNDQDAHRLGWLQSIRTREQPLSSVELGTMVMVIVDLATRSMWEGKAFAFDPKTMTARAV
jgi:predicted dehydrogenase